MTLALAVATVIEKVSGTDVARSFIYDSRAFFRTGACRAVASVRGGLGRWGIKGFRDAWFWTLVRMVLGIRQSMLNAILKRRAEDK